MSSSFNILEEKLESFWNKLNAVMPQSLTDDLNDTQEIPQTTKIKLTNIKPLKEITVSSESDSVSDTESNRYILPDNEHLQEIPVPQPRKIDNSNKLIDELKRKDEERKHNMQNDSDEYRKKNPTKILISKKLNANDIKLFKSENIQTPVVRKVFSKPAKSSTESEISSESESDSNKEESITIESKPKIIKQDKIAEATLQKVFKKCVYTYYF